MTVYCDFCGKAIPDEVVKARHRTSDDTRPITCNLDCENARRKRDGIFKQMSNAGKEGRSRAIPESNRLHPRRKKL